MARRRNSRSIHEGKAAFLYILYKSDELPCFCMTNFEFFL